MPEESELTTFGTPKQSNKELAALVKGRLDTFKSEAQTFLNAARLISEDAKAADKRRSQAERR
jgi:hypothetical protein